MPKSNEPNSSSEENLATGKTDYSFDQLHTHRWTCPYCEQARVVSAANESAEKSDVIGRAKSALGSHVRATDGDGHGPRHAYPEDFDPESVAGYIESLQE